MSTVQTADAELFYDIQGADEPLLLIAEMSCDSSFWLPILPALSAGTSRSFVSEARRSST